MKSCEEKYTQKIKVSQIMLDESISNHASKCIRDKVTALNCIPCLSFSKLFRLKKIYKMSLRIIERWFTTVADSEDFLELDFACVSAILNSSELLIDSELQVFNVMAAWLNHKCIVRNKHAKYLLQRVRLSLLTVPALKNILDKNLWISENDECTDVINEAIRNKNQLHSSAVKSINRCCSQKNFNMLFVSGMNSKSHIVRNAFTIDATNITLNYQYYVNNLPHIKHGRKYSKIFCVKGEVYVIGGFDNKKNQVMAVKKYSPDTNTWNIITHMYDNREGFCACSFIDSIYVLGGLRETNYCLVFNTIHKTWKQIARMNEARCGASCVVFEGRIVVSGGFNNNDGDLNTVKVYDHIDDSWKNMPNMIEERCYHYSVAIKNKLFVVRGLPSINLEVFDSCFNKFVLIKNYPEIFELSYVSKVTSLGNKMVIFCSANRSVFVYDVKKDVWSKNIFVLPQQTNYFSCLKIPKKTT